MEMTSLESGVLLKILVPAGANAKLGQVIAIIGKKDEDISQILAEIESSSASQSTDTSKPEIAEPAPETKAGSFKTEIATQPPKLETPLVQQTEKAKFDDEGKGDGRLFVSPIAARMAAEHGIDLRNVRGSGPGGRIIKRDIEQMLLKAERVEEKELQKPQPSQMLEAPSASAYREESITPMRKTIATRLTQSIGPIPTFYLTVEIEMDNAINLRKQINEKLNDEDKVSLNDIIVKAAAMALMKHPFVNSSYRDDKIRFYEDADIGVAVAIEDGLITPVIRKANRKGITEISREIKQLAARAREKKLQPEEYTGATFSISNLGMFGIKQFTALINPPEAAILAVGTATETPVVRNGNIEIHSIMSVTMSCDHRVIDGATGAKFLQTFKQMLENPILMLL